MRHWIELVVFAMILTIGITLFAVEGPPSDVSHLPYERIIDDALIPGRIERVVEYRQSTRLDVHYAHLPSTISTRRPRSPSTFEILEQARHNRVAEAALRGNPIPDLRIPPIDVRDPPLPERLRAASLIVVPLLIISMVILLVFWMVIEPDR
ncbi:MAG TPA: hypothetical protein VEZ12_19745 [Herpetosiphonaceae bacterium]|jgi:hypothetical protein|nr:hypothetical protein [Herpetosiphonaceae bacterium]